MTISTSITADSAANATQNGQAAHPAPGSRSRRATRRTRSIGALAALCVALLLALMPAGSAHAAEGPVLLRPLARCYPASNGSALVAVNPPQLRPMPSSVTIYVGDNSQSVKYQPYLQRWNGSRWENIAAGPVFTGVTTTFTTSWDSSGGYWSRMVAAQRTAPQYYRVAAQVWWIADATHAGAYSNGLTDTQQYNNIYGWQYVSYCRY